MEAKAQRVQKGAGAQHALMAGEPASNIGQRIGWVGDDKDQRLRCYRYNLRNNFSVYARIGIKKLQSSGWITPVRGPAGLFVDARCDNHELSAGKFVIVAGEEFHSRRESRAVLKIGYHTLRALMVLVQDDDLACDSAHDKRKKTSRADAARSDDAYFHDESPSAYSGRYFARSRAVKKEFLRLTNCRSGCP